MNHPITRLAMVVAIIASLTACADYSSTETRQRKEDVLVFQPKQANSYDSLAIAWAAPGQNATSLNFTINQLTPGDECRQTNIVTEQRTKNNSAVARAGLGAVIFAPIVLLGCSMDDDDSCFTPTYTGWTQVGVKPDGGPAPTGHSEVRALPLQGTFPGTLSITGLDAAGHVLGRRDVKFNFAATDSIALADLVPSFRARPDHLAVSGVFATPKGNESVQLLADAPTLARANFGMYAWKTQDEIHSMQLIAAQQQRVAAAQAAAAAAAAEQQRVEDERIAAEASAERASQSSDDDDMGSAMAGLALGAFVGQQTGSAAIASQVATLAGVNADAANLGAGAVLSQEQQTQARVAEIQQQEASAQAAAQQRQATTLAQEQQARSVQIAYQQQNQQQEAAAQQQREQAAQERATQQQAFATQCLSVRQNYVEPGNPALAVRETQHFVLQNRCSDDVWAFITDSGGNGQGGVVGAGDTREFIFYNKGHGWMKDYKGCIAKYDVDHQCAGNADGLGAY